MHASRFSRFAWAVLALNVLVILWGAVVRATGSGAGCGNHWPDCNGQVVPLAPTTATLIEFIHRVSSGLALLAVVALAVWAFRLPATDGPVRRSAAAAVLFVLIEALVGAGLVLFDLVADNDSPARAVVIAVHLANTLLLLGSLALTAWWGGGGPRVSTRGRGATSAVLLGALAAVMVLGMSGAITALGDTLFPASSLAEGLQSDVSAEAHFLVRLRVWHPLLAVLASAYILVACGWLARGGAGDVDQRLFTVVRALVLVQLGVGALNLALLAPVWLQVVHLLVADLLWIALVLLCAAELAVRPVSTAPAPGATPAVSSAT